MNLKKTSVVVMACILIASNIKEINAVVSLNNERSLVNDVVIVGLKENATLYIGADLELKAFTNEDATIKEIEWITNKDNIVTIEPSRNNAIINAINEGEVSIMARAIDGSDSSRSINVKVIDYNKENNEINLPQGIVPIKCYGITDKVFQVEANRQLSSNERIKSIEVFLSLISFNGNLTLLGVDDISYDNYTIYEIQIGNEQNQKIEIRVDNRDTSYFDKINDILNNLENYQSEIPLTPGMVYIEGNGEDDNPYIVEANENLTSVEKIETVEKYLQELYKWGDLKVVDISESKRYTSYKIKVFRNYARNKNDFYIEIRVDKDDKDSYIPIITMLNKINKHNNNQGPGHNNNNSNSNSNSNNSNGNDIDTNTNTDSKNDSNSNTNANDNITNDVDTNVNNNIDYGTNNLDEEIDFNTTNQNSYEENHNEDNNNISNSNINNNNNYEEKKNESVISSFNYSKEEKFDIINNSKNDVYNENIINYKSVAVTTIGAGCTGLIVSKNRYLKRKQ